MKKFLAYIKPQIAEIISNLYDRGYYPDDLKKPFLQPLFWDQSIPYESAKLHFNNADMTLTGWINAAEAIAGSDTAFNSALIELFKESITEQWAARMEVFVNDGYDILQLHAEHKEVA